MRSAEARAHAGWGILGARIDLIPHQLRVAEIAAKRRPPRLLLADEVGLGKTIQACLIVAQMLASGRASRVCVLLPESLVNQWFVELLRRFNLSFAIFDEERCEAIELNNTGHNPFEDEQCIIASVDWLASHGKRAIQCLDASWDLLLVDEAHHLIWTEEFSSPSYQFVEALSKRTPGLLLLTPTPEQLRLRRPFSPPVFPGPGPLTPIFHPHRRPIPTPASRIWHVEAGPVDTLPGPLEGADRYKGAFDWGYEAIRPGIAAK